MRRSLAVVALAVVLTACSSGDDDGGLVPAAAPSAATEAPAATEAALPACSDLAGTPVDQLQAEADAFAASCTGPSGQAEALAFAFYDCPDGRRLKWNDYGWGYSGDVWQAHARADGQLIPPDADTDACT